jgi:hypothetical protein
MAAELPRFSPEILAALAAFGAAPVETVHRLQVALARLILDQAPPAAAGQLALALACVLRESQLV